MRRRTPVRRRRLADRMEPAGRGRIPDARAADSAWAATAPRLDPVSYSETVVTTLDTGRWLTVGSLASFMSASSYCGSVCTGSFARIATTL